MLERLEDLIHYFLRAPNVGFDELGRAAEKLANLCTVSFDLGSFGDVDHSDISSFFYNLFPVVLTPMVLTLGKLKLIQ